MGFWSIAYSIGVQTASNVQKLFHNPLERAKKKIVRKALKSETVNQLHNAVIRTLASEILLGIIVGVASTITYKEGMPVYNYVLPCVISAVCTEFMREPLNNLCDDYTQPVADRLQSVVVRNWDRQGFWMGVKHGTGITLGAVAIGLSSINDVTYTTVFVTQTLLTSFVVGIVKNDAHPLRTCVRQRMANYRNRPTVYLVNGPLHNVDDNFFQCSQDPDDEFLVRKRSISAPFDDSVKHIAQKVQQRREQRQRRRQQSRVIRIDPCFPEAGSTGTSMFDETGHNSKKSEEQEHCGSYSDPSLDFSVVQMPVF